MAKYMVHYSGYYSYDVTVDAKDRYDARAKADKVFDDAKLEDYFFTDSEPDIWED